MKHYWGCL